MPAPVGERSRPAVAGVKVLLVFQSFRQDTTSFAFLTDVRNLGAIQPLNLLYAGAWLLEAGVEVEFLDANALELTLEQALERARGLDFDLVCFTVTNLDFLFARDWLDAFAREFGKPVLVGGAAAEAYPTDIAAIPSVTTALHGPAELCVVEWIEAWATGGDWWAVPGTCSEYEGTVHDNPRVHLHKDFRRPHPARELTDPSLYYSLLSGEKVFTPAMSVHGCPYPCTFCAVRRMTTHIRSPEDVVDEMELCEKEFGIEEIDYFDAGFTISRERTLRIAELYRRRGLTVSWSARARIDRVDPEQLRAMRSSNCRWLGFGIESVSLGVLDGIDKRQGDLASFHRNLKATRDAGIETVGFFVLGLPGETEATLEATRRFLRRAPLDYVQISPFWPVPRTPIYDAIVEQTGVDTWRNVILHGPQEHLPLLDSELSMVELHGVASQMYSRFYFRPRRVLKLATNIRSPSQLRRYASAGLDVVRGALPIVFGRHR